MQDDTPGVTPEITAAKVLQVIVQAREGDVVAEELRGFIAGLNVDEKAHLTAIAWVGRGAFGAEAYDEAHGACRVILRVPCGSSEEQ